MSDVPPTITPEERAELERRVSENFRVTPEEVQQAQEIRRQQFGNVKERSAEPDWAKNKRFSKNGIPAEGAPQQEKPKRAQKATAGRKQKAGPKKRAPKETSALADIAPKRTFLSFATPQQELEYHVHHALKIIGENPLREGLLETPQRVAESWLEELFSGYRKNPEDVLKTFDREDTSGGDNLVIVQDIPLYSTCEHHLQPIVGTASFAYLPDKRIVGLSKFKRLVDVFARRLQVQERLTDQLADTFHTIVQPKATLVIVRAEHMCMTLRGVQISGTTTVTSAVRGLMLVVPALRQEAMELMRK